MHNICFPHCVLILALDPRVGILQSQSTLIRTGRILLDILTCKLPFNRLALEFMSLALALEELGFVLYRR